MSAVAGWYTDPSGVAGQLRWWDGSQWTDHVTPDPDMIPVQEPGEPDLETEAAETSPPIEREAVAPAQHDPVPSAQPDDTVPEPAPVPSPQPAGTAPEPADAATAGTAADQPAAAWASVSAASARPDGVGEAARGDTASQPPPPSGPPSQEPSWGTGADAGPTPGWQAAELTPRGGNGVRTALIVAAVIAVLAVLVVGAAFVGFVGSFGSVVAGDPFPSDEGWFDDGDGGGEVVHGGELAVGDTIRGSVPTDGTFQFDLVVDAPGEVTIDVRGTDHFDGVAELVDETGQTLDYNDDRSEGGRARASGGSDLDPWLAADLEPGTYQVRVRGFAGEPGTVEVRTS